MAWGPLGWEPVWFSEIEPFPCALLAHHYPNVPNLGDMTQIDGTAWRGQIDVLAGGTPCQAFSVAGQRKSLEDERGNLTLKFVELADAIEPPVLVWENVPGVLSTADNAFGCFLAALVGADRPLLPLKDGGWPSFGMVAGPRRRVAWRVLDAQYFGVAQRRRRVCLVGFDARIQANPGAVLFEPESVPRDSGPRREAGEEVARALTARPNCSHRDDSDTYVPAVSPALKARDYKGPSSDGDGDGAPLVVQSQYGEIAGALTARHPLAEGAHPHAIAFPAEMSATQCARAEDISPALSVKHTTAVAFTQNQQGDVLTGDVCPSMGTNQNATGRNTPKVMAFQERGRDGGRQVETQDDLAYSLNAPSGGGRGQERNIAIGWSEELTAHVDVAATMQRGGDGGRHDGVMTPTMQVRRLTPVECERLQGFPDDYTFIPTARVRKIEADLYAYWRMAHPELTEEEARSMAADGPRYKALGNSWPVPVFNWIGARTEMVLVAIEWKPRAVA